MKFLQNGINKLNGRTAALKGKRNAESELMNSLEDARNQEFQRIDKEFVAEFMKLAEFHEGILSNVDNLQMLQRGIEKVSDAMLSCVSNDIKLLEDILKNPLDTFCYFNAINRYPIHMLLALHKFHETDVQDSIVKLLKYDALDYKSCYYGVSPIVNMLKDTGKLRNSVLERMLADIVKSIDQNNFSLAASLIEYDVAYFRKAQIAAINNRGILCYAVKIAVESNNPHEPCKFIQKLVEEHGFEPSYNGGIALGDAINYAKVLIEKTSLVPSQPVDNVDLLKQLHLDDYAIKQDCHYEDNYKNNEFFQKLKKFAQTRGKLSPHEIAKIEYSPDASSVCIKNMHITIFVAYFLHEHIYPKFTSISFIDCEFETKGDVGLSVFDLLRNSNIREILVRNCNMTDMHGLVLFEVLKYTPNLRKVYLEFNPLLTPKVVEHLCCHYLNNNIHANSKYCKFRFYGIKGPIKLEPMLDLYAQYYSSHILSEIDFCSIDVHFALFRFLSNLSKWSRISNINLISMNISGEIACELIKIINTAPDLSRIVINNCNLDVQAKSLLSSLNLEKLIDSKDSKLNYVSITNCGIKDINISRPLKSSEISSLSPNVFNLNNIQQNSPKTTMPLKDWKNSRTALLNQVLLSNKRVPARWHNTKNLLVLNLLSGGHEMIKNMLLESDKHNTLSMMDKLLYVKTRITNMAKANIDNFFTEYLAELKTIDVNAWVGSIAELHIIARLLSCRIHLYNDGFSSEPSKTYGNELWSKDIHIIKRGHAFYGYSVDIKDIIPNADDDLNLFRACIHAKLNFKSHDNYFEILPTIEQCAKILQIDTAKCIQYSQDICVEDYKAILLRYLEAKSTHELYVAARDLPRANLMVVHKITSCKKMLTAVEDLEKLANSCGISDKSGAQDFEKLLALLDGLLVAHNSKSIIYNLTVNIGDSLDVAKMDLDKIKEMLELDSRTKCEKLEVMLVDNKNIINEIGASRDSLHAVRVDARKKTDESLQKVKNEKMHEIQSGYDKLRKKQKGALVGTAIAMVASSVVGGVLGPVIQSALSSSVGLSALNAKLLADVLISGVVNQAVHGGRLEKLPLNILQNFAISRIATVVTSKLFEGHNVYGIYERNTLPIKPMDINKARVLTVTHKMIETVGNSTIVNPKNVLQDGIVTGLATAVVSTALGVDHTNPNNNKILLDTGTSVMKGVFYGLDDDEILQAAALQALESSAFAVTAKITESIKADIATKPQNNISSENIASISLAPQVKTEQIVANEPAKNISSSKPVNSIPTAASKPVNSIPTTASKVAKSESNVQKESRADNLRNIGLQENGVAEHNPLEYHSRKACAEALPLTFLEKPQRHNVDRMRSLSNGSSHRHSSNNRGFDIGDSSATEKSSSWGTKFLNIFISTADAKELPIYQTSSYKRADTLNVDRVLFEMPGTMLSSSLDPYGNVSLEHRNHVFSRERMQYMGDSYRSTPYYQSLLEGDYSHVTQSDTNCARYKIKFGLDFTAYSSNKLPVWSASTWPQAARNEFMYNPENIYDNYPATSSVKEKSLLFIGGAISIPVTLAKMLATSDDIEQYMYMRTGEFPEYTPDANEIQAIGNAVNMIRNIPNTGLKPLFDAYCEQYKSKISEAEKYRMNGNQFMAGFTSVSANFEVMIDTVSLLQVGSCAARVLPTLNRVATKPLMSVGKQVVRQSKQAYFMGAMGVERGRAAFTLTEALNAPVVNEVRAGLFSSATPKQVLFSQIDMPGNSLSSYAQGNGANLTKNNLLFSKSAKMDFAPTGYLDGQRYPVNQLQILGNYLYKRGVDVVTITRGSPAFQAANRLTGKPTLYFPENPTVLQIKHELSHWLDCKKIGVEKYSQLTRLEKEQMVLDRLKNNRIWKELNIEEREFSIDYVQDIANKMKHENIGVPKHVD
jgi:hypothetical protein